MREMLCYKYIMSTGENLPSELSLTNLSVAKLSWSVKCGSNASDSRNHINTTCTLPSHSSDRMVTTALNSGWIRFSISRLSFSSHINSKPRMFPFLPHSVIIVINSYDHYPVMHSEVISLKKENKTTINCRFEVITDYKVMLECTAYQLKYIVAII